MQFPPSQSPPLTHRQQILLSRETLACEDPICCCEAEPRWRRFEDEIAGRPDPAEWESLDRAPRDEL